MIVTLPTKKGDIDFTLDTSAYADYRFEQHFAKDLGCSFQEYIYRIIHGTGGPRADYLGLLKALYCLLESEQAPTFIDFIKMFDMEHGAKIAEKLGQIFEQIGKSAVKN